MRWFLWTTALLAALPTACRGKPAPAAGQPIGSISAAPVAASAPAPVRSAAPSALERDPLWRQAAGGDSIDLARLAQREGAVGLMAGVELGGAVGRTALSALPYADDGEVALARLCEILGRLPRSEVEIVLRAVHGIAARPVLPRERIDPTGYRSCAPVLANLTDLPPAARDLAVSAQAAVAEHGR